MNILYIGDIMGEVGISTVSKILPGLLKDHQIDLVIAQAENVTEGKGINLKDYNYLKKIGIDFFTGGNWTLNNKEIRPKLSDPNEPIIRPANLPADEPGLGHKFITKNSRTTLAISLLGHTVGKDMNRPIINPLTTIDQILDDTKDQTKDAIIVNFHGDFSSEKVIIGHYLDGRVSAVIGDHWHVPTADARVLAKGTAHISDVGMCGALDASLGVSLTSVIPRWRDNQPTKNTLETKGSKQFNALLVKVNQKGLASSLKQIQKIV